MNHLSSPHVDGSLYSTTAVDTSLHYNAISQSYPLVTPSSSPVVMVSSEFSAPSSSAAKLAPLRGQHLASVVSDMDAESVEEENGLYGPPGFTSDGEVGHFVLCITCFTTVVCSFDFSERQHIKRLCSQY